VGTVEREHTRVNGCAEVNGTIYCAGGNQPASSGLSFYNTVTGQTGQGPVMPAARYNHAMVSCAGEVYVIGGRNPVPGGLATVNVFRYDPGTGSWSQLTNLIAPRDNCVAAQVGGRIYVLGGFNLIGNRIGTNEVFDPQTESWAAIAPAIINGAGSATAIGNKIYITGGLSTSSGEIGARSCHAYDTTTDSWETLPNMPHNRFAHASANVAGLLYVFGGGADVPGAVHSTVDVFDPATGVWGTKGVLNTPRRYSVGCAVGPVIYALFGEDAAANALYSVEAYRPLRDAFLHMKD